MLADFLGLKKRLNDKTSGHSKGVKPLKQKSCRAE
jgi:hypothetical protein